MKLKPYDNSVSRYLANRIQSANDWERVRFWMRVNWHLFAKRKKWCDLHGWEPRTFRPYWYAECDEYAEAKKRQ